MLKVPEYSFFEGFYMWFNKEKKEEYYSTPLYEYGNNINVDFDNKRVKVFIEQNIEKIKPDKYKPVLKTPATMLFPFVDRFGMMLIRLLNADFTNYQTAFNTFFYAYGYELLKEYSSSETLPSRYNTEVSFLKEIEKIFNNSLGLLLELQQEFRNCVDFVYCVDMDIQKEYKPNSRFIAYIIKHIGEIYNYSYKIDIITDNYADKYYDYAQENLDSLISKIDEHSLIVPVTNIYTSTELSNICYVVLEELTKTENIIIKKCKNCGKYFIPTTRFDEIYCDLPNADGTTCRNKGALATYKKNLEDSKALLEYRRSYQKKIMIVSRNREDKQLKKDFDKWKQEAQAKIKLFKQGKLAEDDLYNWIMENK